MARLTFVVRPEQMEGTDLLMQTDSYTGDKHHSGWKDGISRATVRYTEARESALQQFSNTALIRDRAAFVRWKSIENLDKYLIEFESNFIRSGGKVIWAQDISDALEEISRILAKSGSRKVVKSKTRTAAEIGLPARLESEGIHLLETDTGDAAMDGEELNSHMILPAIHKSADEVARLFEERYGSGAGSDAESLVHFLRGRMRNEFLEAGVGITGCNFLVADPGAIVITENEGNAGLCSTLPPVHIVLAGIEKVLPVLSDLELFLPLLSTYGTGQRLTAYNHIITGPRLNDEQEGPSELYVILLDNGRSDVLKHEPQRQAMTCIHCGACQLACPVYTAVGPSRFPGPLDAITRPLKNPADMHERMLSYSAGLCTTVNDVCPVKIDLPGLLLHNRRMFAGDGLTPRSEKLFYFLWKKTMLKRDGMSWSTLKAGKHILSKLHKSSNGLRVMPKQATRSFNDQWREKMNFR